MVEKLPNLLMPRKKISNIQLLNLQVSNLQVSNLLLSNLLLPLLQERDEDPAGNDAEIERLRLGAGEHARALQEKEQTIASKDLELSGKDEEIASRGGEIERLRLGTGEHARMLVERAGKDAEIKRLQARNLENAATLQVPVPHGQLKLPDVSNNEA